MNILVKLQNPRLNVRIRYIITYMLYSVKSIVASSRFLLMNAISSSAGHDDGVMNCPVGDNISGPASLEIDCYCNSDK